MRQRGNLYVYIGAAIAGLGLISALFFGAKSYLDGVDERAYDRGVAKASELFALRDNEALRAANARLAKLTEESRKREIELAKRTAEIDKRREADEEEARARRERDVAAVRAGTLRLRDPGCDRSATPAPVGGGSPAGAAAGTPGGRDGAEGCRLSGQAAEFLLGEAERADEITRQLKSAQELIDSYIDTINKTSELVTKLRKDINGN